MTAPADLEVQKLARQFSAYLVRDIGADLVAEAARLNERDAAAFCHSHDHCDANMTMWDAFVTVYGREPDVSGAGPETPDLDLFNAAWDAARAARFFLPFLLWKDEGEGMGKVFVTDEDPNIPRPFVFEPRPFVPEDPSNWMTKRAARALARKLGATFREG